MSQYWKAWTKVIDRIPPGLTDASTTIATTSEPAHGGAPMVERSVTPAPWNCGSR